MQKNILIKARGLDANAPFHLPPPAQPLLAEIILTVENAPAIPLLVVRDERREFEWCVEMVGNQGVYAAQIAMPMEPTIIRYHFEFPDGTLLQERRQVEGHNHPEYGRYESLDFQISVYDPAAMPAEWTQGMVQYQIYPDSFAKGRAEVVRPQYGPYGHEILMKAWDDPTEHPPLGRDFYGGDLLGVIQKLDYLKDLGVETLYFCPIFHSPTNHRYDAIDYLKIDPMLGTEEDFITLVEAAHARGIKIVLDAVYNHCSADSIYFDLPARGTQGAYHNRQSPYFRWFNFEEWPTEYQAWTIFNVSLKHMPEFVECPEVEAFFLGDEGVTAYWLRRGVDGWRTDVTGYNTDTFWRRFRQLINKMRPDAYLISEDWTNASHYMLGDMFSGTMNYRFAWALEGFFAVEQLTTSQFEDRLATLRRDTPVPALLSQMNLVGSHDVRRILSACGEDKARLKQIVAFQMSYPGAPMIYYGDEAGLTGEYSEASRKAYPWGKEDSEILPFYQHIIKIRAELTALRSGDYETLLVDDERRLHAFARRLGDSVVVAAFNGGNTPASFTIPLADSDGVWQDALGLHEKIQAEAGSLRVSLPPRGFAWFVK